MALEVDALSPGLQRLFEPYASLIGEAGPALPPPLERLDAMLTADRPRTCRGHEVRLVAAGAVPAADYELGIAETGRLPTRPECWHDFFNALVWQVFPHAKAAINALHCGQLSAPAGRARGPLRDALTLFDECGLLVVSSDAGLLDALREHRWQDVLHGRRDEFWRLCRVLVVGHATLDALRAPFEGLCGKALYRQVAAAWLADDAERQRREADRWLADWLLARGEALSPRDFAPLPLLGLPQLTPANEVAGYYRSQQFRPRRSAGRSGLRCI